MITVFTDGAEGTTGLLLEQRLAPVARERGDIRLLAIDPALRKETSERRRLLNQADAVFLCLPDAAAREAVALVENPDTVIIDASTAHRTAPGWAYGFPELSPAHRAAIITGNRIAVPGCYATGFSALVYPLVTRGLLDPARPLSCFALSGYSGGGKKLIADYEDHTGAERGTRPYALPLHHKHLPEMQAVCGLAAPPLFAPAVAQIKQGMLVTVPLHMPAGPLRQALAEHYQGCETVSVLPQDDPGFLEMDTLNGTDKLELFVFGHETQSLLAARLDNLGKGASGAAMQCFKLRFGL